jgi:hypothetical protein
VTTTDLGELEWAITHTSVRPVLADWALACEMDFDAVEVLERGLEVNEDMGTVVGWVRYLVLDANFIAYFGPDRMTAAWLETSGVADKRMLFGPVTDWKSLQEAAQQAEAAPTSP